MTFLNVILHGLYCLVERPTSVEVLMPDMGAEHTYRAGEWLGELVLAPGTYFLGGVLAGNARRDPAKNIVFLGCQPAANPDGLYARIVMPTPHCFSHLRPVTLHSSDLTLDPSIKISSYTISTAQVLTYQIECEDPNRVTLGCHRFTKSVQTFGNDNYMSLHIFSAPDVDELPSHVQAAFAKLMAMGEGLAGKAQLNSAAPVTVPPNEQLPPGIIPAELGSLATRVFGLTVIGRTLRQFPDPVNPPPPIYLGVDGSIVTCTNTNL
jgi:hypothetical protein